WGTAPLDTGSSLAPSVVTSHPSATTVGVGTPVTDSATVASNGVAGFPQGTVTFSICGVLAAPTGCASGGSPAGQAKSTDGTGGPVTSDPFLPDGPGYYCFRAEYSGGGQFAGSSDGSPGECFQVVAKQTGPTYTVNTA